MDNTEKFDGKGELYARARPGYAPELFDHIKHSLPEGSAFADIGSGTGIFTCQLLNCGYRVYAVEPNGDMRKKAEEALSEHKNFVSVDGTDRSTTLPPQSVDCVTAAQAFHWFDPDLFRMECRRILKPHGSVILVYNTRDATTGCTASLADIHRRYCPEFQGFSNGISEETCREFFGGDCEVFRTDNSQSYDRQGFIARALSSSYSLREGDREYAEYLARLHQLFDMFSRSGALVVPMHTVAYIGCFN